VIRLLIVLLVLNLKFVLNVKKALIWILLIFVDLIARYKIAKLVQHLMFVEIVI